MCERLVTGHLAVGDETSAMVTSDWYAAQFPGWAQPKAHAAQLLAGLGRADEARDAAHAALSGGAVWSMDPELVAKTLVLAGLGGGRDLAWFRQQLAASKAAGAAPKESEREAAMARATAIMDDVAVGGRGGWAEAAVELEEAWLKAGRGELAALVRGTMT